MLWLLFLPTVLSQLSPSNFYYPFPTTDFQAVKDVVSRLPPWISQELSLELDMEISPNRATLTIEGNDIHLQGGSGSAILYALNQYLRTYCDTHISWDGNTYSKSCDVPNGIEIHYHAPQVRYFGNPCTFAYSFAWWKWEDWEMFIDWLALNGFNMVLAPIGQETLWRDLFLDMGLSRTDLDDYFTGPAYLPWHRMGNLKGLAGPVSDQFLDAQLELNKMIVTRMASLGIIPVLPTFAGFVPDALVKLHSGKKSWEKQFVRNSCWDGFNETYSCLASVRPQEELFNKIATNFMERQKAAYGELYHVYSADPMNEIPMRLQDFKYLKDLSLSVHTGCTNGDPECIWLLQSWTFSYDKWPKPAVKAFLSGVPIGRLLVLDLFAEHYPLYSHIKNFYGHAFIWSMLHNFGGNTEIRGNIKHPNKHYQVAKTTSTTMVGGGLTMEGIQQNYMQYQFMVDRIWASKMIDTDQWVERFAISRYQGNFTVLVEAWKVIAQTFYAQPLNKTDILRNGNRFENFILKRPKLLENFDYWFNIEYLEGIVERFAVMANQMKQNHLFQMDYNDFRRELLLYKMANDYVIRITEAVGLSDKVMLHDACEVLQASFEELYTLANYDLEEQLEDVRGWGSDAAEGEHFAEGARQLVSIWGPKGENLDYAHRAWKGVIDKYYAPRWRYFCTWLGTTDSIGNRTAFERELFNNVESVFVTLGDANFAYD